ncbi:MAG: NADH-quinone oxidoreductase subunit N [Candidatus Omnitrophica bacterium]|nr:NADH-quinone oxidoreductase subunit N [Candidatus Omnitrophota bacterium]
MNYMTVLYHLIPETTITILIFVILGIDLFLIRNKPLTFRNQFIGLTTGMGLALITIWIVLKQLPLQEPVRLLGDMLVLDPIAIFTKIILMVITVITVLFAISGDFTKHVSEFYAMLLFALLGMIFMIQAEELIMIFVALELTSLSLYIMTAFSTRLRESAEAALKYFLFGSLSSAFMYFGLSYIYGVTGFTDLTNIAAHLTPLPRLMISTDHILVIVGMLFVMVGLGFKIAVVPFHLWAPEAYQGAPTPVTAYIATGSKLASFVVLSKVLFLGFRQMEGSSFHYFWEAGWSPLLVTISILSMTLGNLAAMRQKNLKRLLAYSSIAHSGYILLGVVAATHIGTVAMFYYLVAYVFTNLGAFGFITAVAKHTGGENLENLKGLAKRSPLLSLLMSIFVLSLASIPPLGGFFGKFYLFLSVVGRDQERFGLLWVAGIGIINTMLSLYYYLKILKQMYILKSDNETRIEIPFYMSSALALCAVIVLLTGIFPQPLVTILSRSITFFTV